MIEPTYEFIHIKRRFQLGTKSENCTERYRDYKAYLYLIIQLNISGIIRYISKNTRLKQIFHNLQSGI